MPQLPVHALVRKGSARRGKLGLVERSGLSGLDASCGRSLDKAPASVDGEGWAQFGLNMTITLGLRHREEWDEDGIRGGWGVLCGPSSFTAHLMRYPRPAIVVERKDAHGRSFLGCQTVVK